ncbi:S8 family serine peptidase [Terrabacter sp. MAHUQ-38]|uniref:S8 family peptidase n=1 Tax=unclassified Terrabacter TaxID=2630222 RepID=UPI00165DC353|nr:S8 family serine peptidase [Terrabacter sp. MAHUQ-38]MBC9819911.1 S8 family serine peptidase [Terrabacter sp. MAHUQ-38]
MARRPFLAAAGALALVGAMATVTPAGAATDRISAIPSAEAAAICDDLWSGVFETPSSEPLAGCQWNMALIGADDDTRSRQAGAGVRVGIIDSGVDLTHPDVAPNLDINASCSFVRADDPAIVAGLADDSEAGGGDCSNKGAVDDKSGHGTHVASIVASPVNGLGVAGVAPEATLVALKACTSSGYCFGYAVADALRAAGDLQLDVVNLSLFADPYLYYCGNDATQRAQAAAIRDAARYAQTRGVLIVASNGNETDDLQHPTEDHISPDGPDDTAIERAVGNQCRVLPAELPGAVTVSATGPIGYPGYTMNIASYSSVGSTEVAAPGGDYFSATGTVQDAVLAATPQDGAIWAGFDPLNAAFPGITVIDQGATFVYLNGTSMASPHAAGVAALIVGQHPGWGPSAVKAALLRTASALDCPLDWEPLDPTDERLRCYGSGGGGTSFFGHGLVDADAASRS